MVSFKDLFEQYVGIALDRQLALAEVVQGLDWSVNLDSGILTFGDRLSFAIQVLGSESEYDSTWLWAWANDESELPPELLTRVNALRELGKSAGITEFVQSEWKLNQLSGDDIGLIAVGLFDLGGYYKGDYEGGSVYLLLDAPNPENGTTLAGLRAVTGISQLITSVDVNHRKATEEYAKRKGFVLEERGNGLQLSLPDGQRIEVDFDSLGRVVYLETILKPK